MERILFTPEVLQIFDGRHRQEFMEIFKSHRFRDRKSLGYSGWFFQHDKNSLYYGFLLIRDESGAYALKESPFSEKEFLNGIEQILKTYHRSIVEKRDPFFLFRGRGKDVLQVVSDSRKFPDEVFDIKPEVRFYLFINEFDQIIVTGIEVLGRVQDLDELFGNLNLN
jgi:hypothetical protein